jgi:hypothetical protein
MSHRHDKVYFDLTLKNHLFHLKQYYAKKVHLMNSKKSNGVIE